MRLFSRISQKNALYAVISLMLILALAVVGCSSGGNTSGGEDQLSGTIKIDGSSTVAPISEAVAEEFMAANPGIQVTVGTSGTGGGFKKFTVGEIDISDASRHIKDEEKEAAEKNGIEYIEIPIAYDGISIVVNHNNDWAKSMTVEELNKIWAPDSKVTTWKDVRADWPDEKLVLYGPGTDSGTFDYFTDAINGEEGASRTDYTASEDDNVLVQGVAGDKGSLGYFGYAYYVENTSKIKSLGIDGGNGVVEPTDSTIKDGTYKPLARQIFIYVNKKALERPEVKEFLKFFFTEGKALVAEVGYAPLNDAEYEKHLKLLE
ncbi:MAG: phosphate ABC transporter substrate-binding protein [Candidatus Aquicultor primus]|uniref:Phosphate-binding protein n=1 Tax=Candidatus Aquicultor primus TaxID=1797195 RepID=A0A1F2UUI6_9ACTN|nr:MAG: phosphate ABC transporter substrate-binding protein [Candidatus Aquicultor primus]HCG99344.1 phosphate ABC transporter substrate-binding protein [Actinomycetota bacterium]